MTTKTEYDVDLCVIGGGSAGLSMTAGAAMLGRNVLLFEGAEMGGDCLNHGCVPSKAILKAGKIAHCLLYTSPSPRDGLLSRMPSSA